MKKAENKTFQFRATLESLSNSSYTCIYLPSAIILQLPQKGKIRVKGKVNGTPFNLAIMHVSRDHATAEKNWFLSVGGHLRREVKIKAGASLLVAFKITDPDFIDFPEELEVALEQDPDGKKAFEALTRGYQRSIAYYISTAKKTDSRIKRALEMIERTKSQKIVRNTKK